MKEINTQLEFRSVSEDAFAKTLHKRVSTYLKENGIPRRGNVGLVAKTIVLTGCYIGLYGTLVFSSWIPEGVSWFAWAAMGILLGLIGMNVLHDKVHGSYTNHRIGRFLLEIPIFLIGAESKIWEIEHNHIHHHFTNIDGIDQDISPRFFFRFSPHQKWHWFHRMQAFYAPFLYGLLLFEWLSIKDFIKVRTYLKEGYLSQRQARLLTITIALKKSLFHVIFLLIPLLFGMVWYIVVLKYLLMLTVGGIFMTLIFQLAHVTHNVDFTEGSGMLKDKSWHRFQLETTHNFAPNHWWVTALLGGLNYQIEHHLFPDISHVHYRKLAPLVRKTATEFNYPYHCYPSLGAALWNHFSYLNRMGSPSSVGSSSPSK